MLEIYYLSKFQLYNMLLLLFFKILFIHEILRERGRDIGRGRSRLPTGSPTQYSIPGPRNHDLNWSQTLNHGATQAPQALNFLNEYKTCSGFTRNFLPSFRFFFLRFYLFIHERHTERSRDIGRGRSRLPTGSLMQDSIPGAWDHTLSQRQTLNHWATLVPPSHRLFNLNHSVDVW